MNWLDARTYQVAAALRDGTPVAVRAIRPGDKTLFETSFERQSPETIYRRFFYVKRELTTGDLKLFTELDFIDHVGLAVTGIQNGAERLIGVGRFIRLAATRGRAEIAFVVDGNYRGRGAATLLLQHLVKLALGLGIETFEAWVQTDNEDMLDVFERSGIPLTKAAEDGYTKVILRIATKQA